MIQKNLRSAQQQQKLRLETPNRQTPCIAHEKDNKSRKYLLPKTMLGVAGQTQNSFRNFLYILSHLRLERSDPRLLLLDLGPSFSAWGRAGARTRLGVVGLLLLLLLSPGRGCFDLDFSLERSLAPQKARYHAHKREYTG